MHDPGNAKNMQKNNEWVIAELRIAQKSMERLRESFRLEKEALLEDPGMQSLLDFRERSRAVYSIRLADLSRRVLKLSHMISEDQPGKEAADDLAGICMGTARELDMHFISAPNRLIRVLKDGTSRSGD
jgi:hypothetical protein